MPEPTRGYKSTNAFSLIRLLLRGCRGASSRLFAYSLDRALSRQRAGNGRTALARTVEVGFPENREDITPACIQKGMSIDFALFHLFTQISNAMALAHAWKKLSPKQLNTAIQAFSLVAIFFEGYDQGVMGGVNASPDYVQEVGIGLPDGTVTNETEQGGIVSVYYLGCIVGCFVGGWAADRIGRINGLFLSAVFAVIGGALQAATQSADFIIVSRVVTGLGTGGKRSKSLRKRHANKEITALTGITPVLVSEVSDASHRGSFLGYVFIANYLGISVAYWLSFGLAFVDNGDSAVRWRFLLAFQCFPALILLFGIKLLPDSPRYLASVGRTSEAREVLMQLRGGESEKSAQEFDMIVSMAQESKRTSPVEFVKIVLGLDKQKAPHLGRRAWLSIWLQIMGSWTGITAVTAYSPVLLSQAGYSQIKQNGLAGGLNTIGIVGTIISAQIVDRLGRRTCLMGGAACLALVNLIVSRPKMSATAEL